LAFVSVFGALVLAQTHGLPQPFTALAQPFTALALSAIAITFWYGGTKPGILAALISWLVRAYLFDLEVSAESRLLYGLVFLVFALVMTLVKRRRNELEARVAERTAQLTKTNEDLRVEIATHKGTEEALRRSEAYLAEAQRLSHTGTWAFNRTSALYWSEESYRIWGLDPLQGLPNKETVWQRVHPDDQGRAYDEVQEALRQKRDYAGEFRILLPDGTVKYLQVTNHHVFSESGDFIEVVGTQADVTKRKRAEEAIRESEYKLRQITETVPSFLWSTEPDGETTYVNQRILDYLGTRLEDFRHGGWEAFLHPDDLPESAKSFYQAIQSGTSYEAVHRLRRSDGEYRWHHARGEPLRDREGRIVQWYGLSVDTSARLRSVTSICVATTSTSSPFVENTGWRIDSTYLTVPSGSTILNSLKKPPFPFCACSTSARTRFRSFGWIRCHTASRLGKAVARIKPKNSISLL
jgi:PAS domain S-box-containing protein